MQRSQPLERQYPTPPHPVLPHLVPVVQQRLLVLTDNQLAQLHALQGVERALAEDGAKVDEEGGGLAGGGGHALQRLDGFARAEDTLHVRACV